MTIDGKHYADYETIINMAHVDYLNAIAITELFVTAVEYLFTLQRRM